MTLTSRPWFFWLFQFLLIVSALAAGRSYLFTLEERQVIKIDADRVAEQGLPVYAQFKVTQSLHLQESVLVSDIRVPLYIPDGSKPIRILFYRDSKLLYAWRSSQDQTGTVLSKFTFPSPQLIDGNIEVAFDGKDISVAERDVAPRLFVESADIFFPQGNYRIANNQKQGDVSMYFYSQKPRLDWLLESWRAAPLRVLKIAAQILLLAILLFSFPRLFESQPYYGSQ